LAVVDGGADVFGQTRTGLDQGVDDRDRNIEKSRIGDGGSRCTTAFAWRLAGTTGR